MARILVIDDEASVGDFMGDLLESRGLRVTVMSSSLDALELFAAQPQEFDLVVTDQTMPRMTGIELSCELLQVRANLPVILYTGYGEELSDEKLRECGIRGVLKKPVDIVELCSLINDLLCLARQ